MRARRFAASLLAGLALLAATVAWSAFATSFAVLDPHGSERVADVLVEAPAVRDALAQALAKALRSGPAAEVQVSVAEVESVAHRMLDDPRTMGLLRTAVVGAHQRILGHATGPVRLDATTVAEASRDALIQADPALAASLPTGSLMVDLPTDRLPDLSLLRAHASRVRRGAALAAACLLAGALLLATDDRLRVLRRAGRWAVRTGLASVATGWLLPSLISQADNPRLAFIGALASALGGRMVVPALILVAIGTAVTVTARVLRKAGSGPLGSASPTSLPPVAS